MKETLRDAVIGLGLLCLTTSAITGRLRAAVRHRLSNDLPGVRMSTRVQPSGVLGPVTGRFARLTVEADGLDPDSFALRQAEKRPIAPGRVRLTVVRSRNVPVAGVRAQKAVLAIDDVVTDAVGLVGDGNLSVWRSGRARATVLVDAHSIEQYAVERLTALSEVSAVLSGGVLVATGYLANSSPRRSVVLRGRLVAADDALAIAEPEVWLDGSRAPDAMARLLVLAAGPVMRLSDAGGVTARFRLHDVRVGEGVVLLDLEMPPFAGPLGR